MYMASSRYALAARSYITDVVLPNQKQLCVPWPRYKSHSVITNPREKYKKTYKKLDLSSNIHDGYWMSGKHDWKGTVMLITGASKGIGSHIVRMGLKEGVKHVVNLDIDEKGGLALQYELNQKYCDKTKVKHIYCDVTNEQQLIENFQSVLGYKDFKYVVVNNAGILNNTAQKSDEEIDTNMTGLITSSLTALELMRKDKEGMGGAIINLSPAAALCPLPYTPTYKATKNAVLTLSLGLGNEEFYSRSGVRVMTVCYGATDAGFIQLNDTATFETETEPKYSTTLQPFPGHWNKSAAKAVIDIYKHGGSGSIWISKEDKPAEDITFIVRKSYSVVSEPKFTTPP